MTGHVGADCPRSRALTDTAELVGAGFDKKPRAKGARRCGLCSMEVEAGQLVGSLRAIRRPDGRFSWALAHDSENRGALWLSVTARLQRGITGGRKGQQRAAVQGAAETTVGVWLLVGDLASRVLLVPSCVKHFRTATYRRPFFLHRYASCFFAHVHLSLAQ